MYRPGERVPAPNHAPDVLAPWPNVDRYPIVIGSRVSFDYISACKRQARFGYRLQWVDLLEELRDRDPSAFSNLTARIIATAGGRMQVVSASTMFEPTELGDAERERVRLVRQAAGLSADPLSLTDDERVLADQIAAHVQRQVDGLPGRPQILARQLWSIYFGVACDELLWDRTPTEWRLRDLHFVHPRRVAYPDQNNWHPHLWDQGLVAPTGPEWKDYLSQGLFGFDICDYPCKFLVHVPVIMGGYPTADGLGTVLAWWIAAKLMGARSYMQNVERYAKPGIVATYNTNHDDGKPRNAGEDDIKLAQQVVQAMGYGGAPGATIPSSIKMEMFGPAAMKGGSNASDPRSFVEWCDDQIARAVRTTDALQGLQRNGARSALETLAKSANRVAFYDAVGLSATWTRDIAAPITALNYPEYARLAPAIVIHVDDEPGPEVWLERIKELVSVGAPVDADKAAAKVGASDILAAMGNADARILYATKGLQVLPPQHPADAAQDDEQETKPNNDAANAEEDTNQ